MTDNGFYSFRKRLRRLGLLRHPFGNVAQSLDAVGGHTPALLAPPAGPTPPRSRRWQSGR